MNVFNSERNVIITANEKINASQLESFLEKNLNKFHIGSRVFMMAGLHHEKGDDGVVQIGESDSGLIGQFESAMGRIITKCNKPCEDDCSKCKQCGELHSQICHVEGNKCEVEDPCHHKCSKCEKCQELHSEECGKFCLNCTWKVKKIVMGETIAIYSKKVRRSNVLKETSRNTIKAKFEHLLNAKYPHVFIFASCFSHQSEINHVLRSSGMYSCLLVSAERGEITCGKVFKLDPEQQAVMKLIVENSIIKDVIFLGKLTYFISFKFQKVIKQLIFCKQSNHQNMHIFVYMGSWGCTVDFVNQN